MHNRASWEGLAPQTSENEGSQGCREAHESPLVRLAPGMFLHLFPDLSRPFRVRVTGKCLLNKRVGPVPLEPLSVGTAAKLCGSISSSPLDGTRLTCLAVQS